MSDAKHTPGPWNYTLCDGESAWLVGPRNAEGPDYVADAHKLTHGRRDEDSEANARLIAAAPELLAACESVIEEYGGHHATGCVERPDDKGGCCFVAMVRAAIAKARGGQ